MYVKLSVIVPIYNTKGYLERCVLSILDQTTKNIEIILVDDGSPDGAGEICDQLKDRYDNIKVIHKANEGLGFARNSGLNMAIGEYVAFLDSDDFVDKGFYEELITMCEKYQADACYVSGFYQFKDPNTRKTFFYNDITNKVIQCQEEIKAMIPRIISRRPDLDDNIPGSSCMAVYDHRFLKDNGLRFITEKDFISEDVWFNMDVFCHANRICYSSCVGYNYRYNANSLSRGYNPDRFSLLVCSCDKLINRCEKLGLTDHIDRIALYFWVNFEKCINQEVIYEKNKISNIRKMTEHTLSDQLLSQLVDDQKFCGLHAMLCRMVFKKRFALVVLLLSIYNKIRVILPT